MQPLGVDGRGVTVSLTIPGGLFRALAVASGLLATLLAVDLAIRSFAAPWCPSIGPGAYQCVRVRDLGVGYEIATALVLGAGAALAWRTAVRQSHLGY